MPPVIEVVDVRKSYRQREVLRGVSFAIAEGERFCLLGSNGAGKTTLMEVLEGYRSADSGLVRVLGVDPAKSGYRWRQNLGIVMQESGTDRYMTVAETLSLQASMFPRPFRVDDVVEMLGLGDCKGSRTGRLSGGQRRKVDLALALIGNPALLFLDEPTSGFDPTARRGAWELVERLSKAGTTVVLTTHFLDEAEALADRIAFLAAGQVTAIGTPLEMTRRSATHSRISFIPPPGTQPSDLPIVVEVRAGRAEVTTDRPTAVVADLTSWAVAGGFELEGLTVNPKSLEDAYMDLVGRPHPHPDVVEVRKSELRAS